MIQRLIYDHAACQCVISFVQCMFQDKPIVILDTKPYQSQPSTKGEGGRVHCSKQLNGSKRKINSEKRNQKGPSWSTGTKGGAVVRSTRLYTLRASLDRGITQQVCYQTVNQGSRLDSKKTSRSRTFLVQNKETEGLHYQ